MPQPPQQQPLLLFVLIGNGKPGVLREMCTVRQIKTKREEKGGWRAGQRVGEEQLDKGKDRARSTGTKELADIRFVGSRENQGRQRRDDSEEKTPKPRATVPTPTTLYLLSGSV